jgi:hypothetical protein
MAQIYANLIRKGIKTISEVPQNIKAEVEMLIQVGTDA